MSGLDGWFFVVVFVHESMLAENAASNDVPPLNGAELLVHICCHVIVEGLVDPGGFVCIVVAGSEYSANVHVAVCV